MSVTTNDKMTGVNTGSGGGGGGTTFNANATYGWAEATVSGSTYVALPTDGAGNVKGNVTPRTGTYAALISLDGGAGELSSITDQVGVVKHTGVAGAAQFIGSQLTIDVSLFTTANPTLVVPPGASRVVIAWISSQTGPASSLQISFNPTKYQPGQKVEFVYLARSGADTFSPSGSGISLSRSRPKCTVEIDATGTIFQTSYDINPTGTSTLGAVIAGSLDSSSTGANSLAIGLSSFADGGGVGIGASTNSPNCQATFYAGISGVSAGMATGKVLLCKQNPTPGVFYRLPAGDSEGTSYPTPAILVGRYRITVIAINADFTQYSKFVRDFTTLVGVIKDITTPIADIQGAGMSAAINPPSIDANEINITAKNSEANTIYGILEFDHLA